MGKADEMPEGKALTLKDQIQYADNSIVSKTIIDKKTGTVTLFAFDDGQKLSEHTTLAVAVENITDEDYRIHGSGQNEPGRNFILSLDQAF